MLEAGLNASLELQCRKTMEIRAKRVRAGFEAGLEGLKAMEIGAKEYDKEGALFWTSKRKKKQARRNGPPQFLPHAPEVVAQQRFHVLPIPYREMSPLWCISVNLY